jgi:hypothetical protein
MSINLLDFNDDILHIIEMENKQNKIKCDICNSKKLYVTSFTII